MATLRKKAIRKRTKRPLGMLKRKLDSAFGKMVMERDKGKLCISCGTAIATQPGHFMRLGLQATRWHPLNVNGQCFRCNCVESGNQLEYAEALDRIHWDPCRVSTELRKLSHISWKPSREALERLLAAAQIGPEAYNETWDFYGAKL